MSDDGILWVACLACQVAWRIDFDPDPGCPHNDAPMFFLHPLEPYDFDDDDVLMLANDNAIRYPPEKPTSSAG